MPAEKPCGHCGIIFKPTCYGVKEQRFCSRSCSTKAIPRGGWGRVKYSEPSYYKRNAKALCRQASLKLQTDPLFRKQCNAHVLAQAAHPIRQPCEVCGRPNAERHHDDYDKPKEIRWLCPSCHKKHHLKQKAATA